MADFGADGGKAGHFTARDAAAASQALIAPFTMITPLVTVSAMRKAPNRVVHSVYLVVFGGPPPNSRLKIPRNDRFIRRCSTGLHLRELNSFLVKGIFTLPTSCLLPPW